MRPMPQPHMLAPASRQSGVAVVTALLLTTLAVTIVASVFWQQQVQVRSVENQRLQSQTQWVLRAALDWTRIILREDARTTAVDQLGEAWATPLPETHLDDYADSNSAVTLTGYVIDAQSRYNLSDLAQGGVPDPVEIAVYARLLASLKLNAGLAQTTALAIATTQVMTPQVPAKGTTPAQAPATPPVESRAKAAQLLHLEDLISIPGYSPAVIDKLKDYAVILPVPTPVNVNTAGREVLAAKLNLSRETAANLVAMRDRAYFVSPVDFQTRAQTGSSADENSIDVKTDYFMVYSKVQMGKADLAMQALIYRKKTGNTTIMWLREY